MLLLMNDSQIKRAKTALVSFIYVLPVDTDQVFIDVAVTWLIICYHMVAGYLYTESRWSSIALHEGSSTYYIITHLRLVNDLLFALYGVGVLSLMLYTVCAVALNI